MHFLPPRSPRWSAILLLLASAGLAATQEPPIRVTTRLETPAEHPDYSRRAVKPPGWDVFDNLTQFTTVRGFAVADGRIVDIQKTLDQHTVKHELGRVIWPSYPILFAKNLDELAAEIRRRNLYLFDIWGYVPGSGPGGYWQQFRPPATSFAVLEQTLGDRWFGTDIGEQDGRYIGGYAPQMTPTSSSRMDQYLNFQRHFERMGNDLGNRHATLVSLSYGHYLLKEGTYTLIGAETAQGLPNAQVFYSFIRGAGKQYGVPWFGNVSVWNRWGSKSYSGGEGGPTQGTSLSLLKRLMYSHILYNCVAVGFEAAWFDKDGALSPVGRIQESAQRWMKQAGPPGVQQTPIALMLDFDAGWTVPRHLYAGATYRVWGNLPYEARDYLADDILDMMYPGYADSSYFHDESGFSTATPYGDIADCLLSDAPSWLIDRYGVVIADVKSRDRELHDKLEAYVSRGGHLVLVGEKWVGETGKGRITVLPGDGLAGDVRRPAHAGVDRHLESPRPLSVATRETLDRIFRSQRLFEVDPRLALIVCRKQAGEYTLGILNNAWSELPLEIKSLCGPIESVRELPLDTAERAAVGFTPAGLEKVSLGSNTVAAIAGGDVRIFQVHVKESGVAEVPHSTPLPRPKGVVLPLRNLASIKEEILRRPTFFQHFDGVMIDWSYLRNREKAALTNEAGWIKRQGLSVMVDLSSGMNLYPDLRLLNNDPADYEASMAAVSDVLEKMQIIGARHLLLSLHRLPENNFHGGWEGFDPALKKIADEAAGRGIVVCLRTAPGKTPGDLLAVLTRVGAPNLKLALSTSQMDAGMPDDKTLAAAALWLASSLTRDAVTGERVSVYGRLHGGDDARRAQELTAGSRDMPVVLDGVYDTQDEEYLDAMELGR